MRTYYDHERAYRMIAEAGGAGRDDLPSSQGPHAESYLGLDAFLASPLAMPGDALDLGCGGGQASMKLAARGYRVVGIDFAPSAIALARRALRSRHRQPRASLHHRRRSRALPR